MSNQKRVEKSGELFFSFTSDFHMHFVSVILRYIDTFSSGTIHAIGSSEVSGFKVVNLIYIL